MMSVPLRSCVAGTIMGGLHPLEKRAQSNKARAKTKAPGCPGASRGVANSAPSPLPAGRSLRETWPAATAGAEVRRGEAPRAPLRGQTGKRAAMLRAVRRVLFGVLLGAIGIACGGPEKASVERVVTPPASRA